MSESPTPAEAAANEAEDKGKHVLKLGDLELVIPRKFKRFKFMRRMSSGDLWGALECVFDEDQLEILEESDVDEDELSAIVEGLGNSLIGDSTKNSKASPRS